MVKSSYSEVRKGTKKAKILEMILRKQGVTYHEAEAVLGVSGYSLHHAVASLKDMNGYDIRPFKVGGKRAAHSAQKQVIAYCCVGRFHWNGEYTDYTTDIQKEIV